MCDLNAQLLVEFADQAGLGALARLDLAARKLPKAGQLFALGALAKQHPPVRIHEGGGGDQQDRFVGGRRGGQDR